MRGFVRRRDRYEARLDAVERSILASVVADTALLLGVRLDDDGARDPDGARAASGFPLSGLDWSETVRAAPSDPALARLLPAASRDDAALADEFRRFTEDDLRRVKTDNLRAVWTALRGPAGPFAVPRAEAGGWAAALTDVRLVLAARLGIESDADAERVHAEAEGGRDPGDEATGDEETGDEQSGDEVHAALATLYAALTWLQESLMAVMLSDLPGTGQ
jgi:hypothetical protein